MDREAESVALEKKHVKDVYEKIAKHFTDKRYKAWPQVKDFLKSLEPGSVVADIGCGSGKYLNINPDIYVVGSDCCCQLAEISRARGGEIMVCDNLNLPYRDNCFDAVISIAVIHHFATVERRIQALQELARICRPGGLIMIYVWALEQKQRKFDAQDVLVPWHMPQKHSKHRRNGHCPSAHPTTFTVGCPDDSSTHSVLPTEGGPSSSDTSPSGSPQHRTRPTSKSLTKCLSDASLQPNSKRAPSMQEPSMSSQSLSSLSQDENVVPSKDCPVSRNASSKERLEQLNMIKTNGTVSQKDFCEDDYVDISFGKSKNIVKERLYKGFNGGSESDLEVNGGLNGKEDRATLGGSLGSLGRFEANPLVTVMRSLAQLEKSLSLPETAREEPISNGIHKDLRIHQLVTRHASVGVNPVNVRGETYLRRTKGHGRSTSFSHHTSRDSSMESLSSSDDSVTTIPVDARTDTRTDARKQHLERRHQRVSQDRVSRSVPGSPQVMTNGSNHFFGRSNSLPEGGDADFSKFLRYYHVFREGELVSLIEEHVPTLHIVRDYFDHANWCVVAEKVQCWSI